MSAPVRPLPAVTAALARIAKAWGVFVAVLYVAPWVLTALTLVEMFQLRPCVGIYIWITGGS